MKKIFLVAVVVIINFSAYSQNHWESIIVANDQWKYLAATSQPPANWNLSGFDDSSWLTGMGGVGYGDNDDSTTLISPVNSVYLRVKFQLADKSLIQKLILDIDYDDAFVAYLNGVEIARSSNVTANPPLYNSTISSLHEALMYSGGQPERHVLTLSNLENGENTLAVQILNESLGSSDLTGLVFLNAKINSPSILYKPTPPWFITPVEYDESNIPIIVINTNGQTIVDEPKIIASLGIIDNVGTINRITDPFTSQVDYIGIEIRGSSSQMFEKKSYGFETRTSTGDNYNVALLGLPSENDWVLYGPYTDKSLMRNALTYYLGNKTGHWTPHTRYCELYINGDYRGVYLLIEKIKRDNNRVNISKLEPTEISGSDLTGGYILSIDRPDDLYWISPYKGLNGYSDIVINYIYPDFSTMPDQQKQYIKTYVTSFENALNGPNYLDPSIGYRGYSEINSFIDYFLINEFSRNVDGYRLSTFFYKDKGGKLTMGPLWDYDLAFGNADYYDGFNTQGWVVQGVGTGDSFQIPFWWTKMQTDTYFNVAMKTRWLELRQSSLKRDSIYNYIDSVANLLSDAHVRNFDRFKILGLYVWPNYFIGQTYEDEIGYLKNWISQRLDWMDQQISLISKIDDNPIGNAYESYAFPNPFIDRLTIRTEIFTKSIVEVRIFNILGQMVYSEKNQFNPGTVDFKIPTGIFEKNEGIYVYEIRVDGKQLISRKLIRQQ
jgi:hypothetical protein